MTLENIQITKLIKTNKSMKVLRSKVTRVGIKDSRLKVKQCKLVYEKNL